GEHRQPVLQSDLPFGDYRLQITAKDLGTNEQEVYQAALSNSMDLLDNLPLAHSIVQNVDLHDGNLGLARADIDLGGRGPGLRFTRTYSSPRPDQGDFNALGYGWHTNLEYHVKSAGGCGGVLVTGADGGAQRFVDPVLQSNGDFVFQPLHGYHGSFVAHGDLSSDYYSVDGTRYHYGISDNPSVMALLFIEDVDGNRIDYSYAISDIDGAAHVTEIRDSAGRSLHFNYSAITESCRSFPGAPPSTQCVGSIRHSALTSVTGPDGLKVNYSYDVSAPGTGGTGMLVSAIREGGSCAPGQCETYSYTDLGWSSYLIPGAEVSSFVHHGLALTGITQTDNGNATYAYQRLALNQRLFDVDHFIVIQIPTYGVNNETVFDGGHWGFSYVPTARGLGSASTLVNDGRGKIATYTLNGYGSAERVEDPAGSTLTTWDFIHFQPASITDALGRVTSYDYDVHGNKLRETITGGVTRSWTYQAPDTFAVPIKNRASTFTDARGMVETYAYDATGHLIERTRGGVTESFGYDGLGDRVQQTDFNGGHWSFGFDGFGYPASQSTPLGEIAFSNYDARGRLLSESDAKGNTTTHTYDASDRRLSSSLIGPGGGTRRTAYTDGGRTQTVTDEIGKVTVSHFDPLGRLLSVRNALGDTRTLQYDGNGNKVSETDFRGNTTSFVYDDANRLVTTTAPLGKVTTLTVDALGHVLSETLTGPNSATHETHYLYEHPLYFRTRSTQIGGPGGDRETTITPDNAGNPLSTRDALGRITTRTFDAFDRITAISEPGRSTALVYDANGKKLSETISAPTSLNRTRSWAYDAANRNISSTDGVGNISHTTYY
ncbi:MAG: hypothetical protein CO182_11755, partial [Lysobacterales bacterium CG_4_9_14_3_um_filter_62_6]